MAGLIQYKQGSNDFSNLGDTSTLLDPSVVEEIKAGAIKWGGTFVGEIRPITFEISPKQ